MLQSLVGGGDPAALVHPWAVARAGGRGVEVDEDGVEESGLADERLRAAIVFQGNAWLGEQWAFGDVGTMPVRDGGQWLCDDEIGALLRKFFGNGGDGVAQAKAGEPDLRLAGGAEGCAGEAGELFFSSAGGWAADLLAVDEQGFAPVMLLEGKDVSI